MGLRFQRRIKILPGLSINLSKSGVGFSVGARGFHTGIDAKGRHYTSASIPGTGLSWRQYRKTGTHVAHHPQQRPFTFPPPLPGARAVQQRIATRFIGAVLILLVLVLLLAHLVVR